MSMKIEKYDIYNNKNVVIKTVYNNLDISEYKNKGYYYKKYTIYSGYDYDITELEFEKEI